MTPNIVSISTIKKFRFGNVLASIDISNINLKEKNKITNNNRLKKKITSQMLTRDI